MALTACAAATTGAEPVPVTGQPHAAPAPAGSSDPATPTAKPEAPPRYAPPVSEPRDARGVAPCDLLAPAQLLELGFRPGSAEPGTSGAALTCTWRTDKPGQPAALQINTDPTIPALDIVYGIRDVFAVFEPTEIAGHPAVRADYNDDQGCVIYTAIADYQGMATGTGIGVGDQADPCAGSRRMAELILSNLPPLR